MRVTSTDRLSAASYSQAELALARCLRVGHCLLEASPVATVIRPTQILLGEICGKRRNVRGTRAGGPRMLNCLVQTVIRLVIFARALRIIARSYNALANSE